MQFLFYTFYFQSQKSSYKSSSSNKLCLLKLIIPFYIKYYQYVYYEYYKYNRNELYMQQFFY